MTQVEYRLKLGQDEFTIKAEVEDAIDFFEKMSFYSNLPKVGPNGETDLKVTHRTTKDGYNYYSLVSEKAGQEFKFGQLREGKGGVLFPKGWEPLYNPNSGEQTQSAPVQIGQALPAQSAVPTPIQQAAFPGMVNPVVGPSAAAPTPVAAQAPIQPTPAAVPQQAAPAANPQVAAVANNVLARFGINKQ